jgi:hypothetical protein
MAEKQPIPKVTHQNIRPYIGKFKMLWTEFSKSVLKEAERRIKEGDIPWQDVSLDNLLVQRRELLAASKAGMLKREDQENLIGFLAAVIWFLRQEEAKQARILEIW